jgi:hypothetical protein
MDGMRAEFDTSSMLERGISGGIMAGHFNGYLRSNLLIWRA